MEGPVPRITQDATTAGAACRSKLLGAQNLVGMAQTAHPTLSDAHEAVASATLMADGMSASWLKIRQYTCVVSRVCVCV